MGASLWEDVCVQVQGEESVFWRAYEDQIDAFARMELAQLTNDERAVIWTQTDRGWDWCYDHFGENTDTTIPTDMDDLVAYISQEVKNRAANYTTRRIERLLMREHD